MAREIGVFVAWPYANGDMHLGHVAGAYLPADIFARYHRLRGDKVLMVSGSDSHGTPITLKAKQEGLSPLEVVNRYHARFLEGWQKLGITFDLFTHTNTKNHIEITQDFFRKIRDKGALSRGTQAQFYDESAEMFLPDRYVSGTCPVCQYERARGDQCENCGKTYSAAELLHPVSSISKTQPVLRDTEHYFFEMGKFQEKLLSYLAKQKHWRLNVHKFSTSMVEEGLPPRAITRDIDWGVPVPEEGWEDKVIYVWFDAVIGYFSASKEWAKLKGDESLADAWWKNPESRSFYFIGKDNIPFHTVIWPIELMAYDESLNLPYDVPANQFLNIQGEKFSTSRGLAFWLLDVLEQIDVDALRYYMTSILPETKDANFSFDELITRNNGELVAAWGNLVNRVFGFAYKRYEGKIPNPKPLDERDKQLLSTIENGFELVGKCYEEVRLRDALRESMALAREVNRYLDEKAPWTSFKTDPEEAGTAIYVAMRAIDSIKTLLAPVLPETSQKIHDFFGYEEPLFGSLVIEDLGGTEDPHQAICYQATDSEIAEKNLWLPSKLEPGRAFKKAEPLYKLLEPECFGASTADNG